MPEAKKLIIEALANVKGVADLSKAVKTLTRDAGDLSKVLGKVNIGGLNGPTNQKGITKQFDEMLKKLREVGVVTKDTAKILGETMGRAVDQERQKLKELTATLKDTENQYKAAKDRAAQFANSLKTGVGPDGNPLADRDVTQGLYNQAREKESALGQRHGDLSGQIDKTSKNLGINQPGFIKGLAAELIPKLGTAMFAINLGRDLVNGASFVDRQDNMAGEIRLREARATQTFEARLRTGDLKAGLAMERLLADPDRRQALLSQTSGLRKALGYVQDGATGLIHAGTGRVLTGASDIQQALMSASTQERERVARMVGIEEGTNILDNQGLDFLHSNAETLRSFMQLSGNGRLGGAFAAARAGSSLPDFLSAASTLINRGGRGAERFSGSVLAGKRAGLDPGALASLGIGPLSAGKLIQHLIASTGNSGTMNLAAANLISGFVGQNFSGGAGFTDGSGLMSALSFGTGGDMGAVMAQANIAGLGGLKRLMSGGSDGFQRGRNLVTATNVLGPGGSLEAIQSLAGLSDMPRMLEILRSGKVSGAMAAMGITGSQAQSFIHQTFSSLSSRALGENDGSRLSTLMRAMRDGTVDFDDVVSGKGGIAKKLGMSQSQLDDAAVAFISERSGMVENGDENAARGVLNDVRGALTGKLRTGKGRDGASGTEAEGQAIADIKGVIKQLLSGLTAFGTANEGAKTHIENLGTSAEKVQRQNEKIEVAQEALLKRYRAEDARNRRLMTGK